MLNIYIVSEINRKRNRDIRRSSSKVYELEQERMKFIFVASFYGQQNFKLCNTFCFACSLTLVRLQPSVCREQNGGQSRLWVLFLSRGDSEELTWQSLDLTSGEAWTTSSLGLCHDCFPLHDFQIHHILIKQY